MRWIGWLVLVCLGCDQASGVTSQVRVGGPAAEIIGEKLVDAKLMRSIKGTYLIEEKRGDGQLGPSDYELFVRIDIDPSQAQAWRAHLKPQATGEPLAQFKRPRYEVDWWPKESPLSTARAVGGPTLWKGARHGWAALTPEGNRVYLYSYTR